MIGSVRDDADFRVVVNRYRQASIWPADRPLPHGWADTGTSGTRRACLASIERLDSVAQSDPQADFSTISPPKVPTAEYSYLRGPARPTPDVSITELIRSARVPDEHVAASCGSDTVTRRELFETAADWAAKLVVLGCGPETPVAVILPRTLDALTAVLAVLEAGGAYVPVSPDESPENVVSILRDCGASIVIGSDDLEEKLADYTGHILTTVSLRLQETPQVAIRGAAGSDLAYIFYTSGTTGKPKGVEGTHRQLVNYALWCGRAFPLKPNETIFLSASLFFLGSLTTIFTPLVEGWPITIVPDGATTDELLGLSSTTCAGLLKLTPTHIRMMMARGVPDAGLARQLMVGSEPLTMTHDLQKWMTADRDRIVVNHYGLTETHGCFCHWLTGDEDLNTMVPIGMPIDNLQAYVINSSGELATVGEMGELLVGGPSIARGYRGRPSQTAERWIPNPWGTDGARLLRTGDLARVDSNGIVTIVGRADRQVKVRGHRVEPAAIEFALRQLDGVREALVLPQRIGDEVSLRAYILRDVDIDIEPVVIRDKLLSKFPPQWVPTRMAVLSEFPVNPNGKVDVGRLPDACPVAPVQAAEDRPGRWSRMDRLVADAFCDCLQIDEIGLHDDFFALGGDSLTATRLAAQVGRSLGRHVPTPTVAGATVREYSLLISDLIAADAAAMSEP